MSTSLASMPFRFYQFKLKEHENIFGVVSSSNKLIGYVSESKVEKGRYFYFLGDVVSDCFDNIDDAIEELISYNLDVITGKKWTEKKK